MLSVINHVKTKRLGMHLSITVGARRRSHGGLTTLIVSHLHGRRVVPYRQAQLRRAQPITRLRWPSD
jgi:hypothetical protein